jgi:hypothetical protein
MIVTLLASVSAMASAELRAGVAAADEDDVLPRVLVQLRRVTAVLDAASLEGLQGVELRRDLAEREDDRVALVQAEAAAALRRDRQPWSCRSGMPSTVCPSANSAPNFFACRPAGRTCPGR